MKKLQTKIQRPVLKYTGTKTSSELGSAMIPESTLIIPKLMIGRPAKRQTKFGER